MATLTAENGLDVAIVSAEIRHPQTREAYCAYSILVSCPFGSRTVGRRYREFAALYESLFDIYGFVYRKFPQRSPWWRYLFSGLMVDFEPDVLFERQVCFEEFLREALKHTAIVRSPELKAFLQIDALYDNVIPGLLQRSRPAELRLYFSSLQNLSIPASENAELLIPLLDGTDPHSDVEMGSEPNLRSRKSSSASSQPDLEIDDSECDTETHQRDTSMFSTFTSDSHDLHDLASMVTETFRSFAGDHSVLDPHTSMLLAESVRRDLQLESQHQRKQNISTTGSLQFLNQTTDALPSASRHSQPFSGHHRVNVTVDTPAQPSPRDSAPYTPSYTPSHRRQGSTSTGPATDPIPIHVRSRRHHSLAEPDTASKPRRRKHHTDPSHKTRHRSNRQRLYSSQVDSQHRAKNMTSRAAHGPHRSHNAGNSGGQGVLDGSYLQTPTSAPNLTPAAARRARWASLASPESSPLAGSGSSGWKGKTASTSDTPDTPTTLQASYTRAQAEAIHVSPKESGELADHGDGGHHYEAEDVYSDADGSGADESWRLDEEEGTASEESGNRSRRSGSETGSDDSEGGYSSSDDEPTEMHREGGRRGGAEGYGGSGDHVATRRSAAHDDEYMAARERFGSESQTVVAGSSLQSSVSSHNGSGFMQQFIVAASPPTPQHLGSGQRRLEEVAYGNPTSPRPRFPRYGSSTSVHAHGGMRSPGPYEDVGSTLWPAAETSLNESIASATAAQVLQADPSPPPPLMMDAASTPAASTSISATYDGVSVSSPVSSQRTSTAPPIALESSAGTLSSSNVRELAKQAPRQGTARTGPFASRSVSGEGVGLQSRASSVTGGMEGRSYRDSLLPGSGTSHAGYDSKPSANNTVAPAR